MVHTKTDSIKTDDPWNVINNLFGNSKDKWYSTSGVFGSYLYNT